MEIGTMIKRLRMENKLSQQELGEKSNITQHLLSQYETGKRGLINPTLHKILNELGHKLDLKKDIELDEYLEFEITFCTEHIYNTFKSYGGVLSPIVVMVNFYTLELVPTSFVERYLNENYCTFTVCTITSSDYQKGQDYIKELIKSKYYSIIHSNEYELKCLIDSYLGDNASHLKIDIINNFLYVDNFKVCLLDLIESFDTDANAIILNMVDGTTFFIVLSNIESKNCISLQIQFKELCNCLLKYHDEFEDDYDFNEEADCRDFDYHIHVVYERYIEYNN